MRSTDDCLLCDDLRLVLPEKVPTGIASVVSFVVVMGNLRVLGLREEGTPSAHPSTFTCNWFCQRWCGQI